jgi:hypothetical protein
MILIKLKSKISSELVNVFAVQVLKTGKVFNIELTAQTDTDKLELAGFEPEFETLLLTPEEFVNHVHNIQNVG